ncbi:hypothetical protein HDU88_006715 [Geranomyces variabilis]|nr:hypothetical protein HDU88_006715 [Geranomyces variabilis]
MERTFAPHQTIAMLYRRAIAAIPERDLMDVHWDAVPVPAATTTTTTITTNAAGEDEEVEVEEEVLAQWVVAGRRSLRLAAVRLARRIEKHQLSAGDIAALGTIIEAPAADWAAVLEEMTPRIGEDRTRRRP